MDSSILVFTQSKVERNAEKEDTSKIEREKERVHLRELKTSMSATKCGGVFQAKLTWLS